MRSWINCFFFLLCFDYRKQKLDFDLDVGGTENLLDNSAAKHKLAVKPKKNHMGTIQRAASPQPSKLPVPKADDKWVKIFFYF